MVIKNECDIEIYHAIKVFPQIFIQNLSSPYQWDLKFFKSQATWILRIKYILG